MRVICCMCGIALRDIESAVHLKDAVSHGLCETCFHSMKAQLGMTLDEYIEGIPAPVAVLDDKGEILYANAQASAMLKRPPGADANVGSLVIFDCPYARQETGCGHNLCCSGCTIRQSVAKTHQTGLPRRDVPAVQHNPSDTTLQVDLFITTMKKGEVVHLSIQENSREI